MSEKIPLGSEPAPPPYPQGPPQPQPVTVVTVQPAPVPTVQFKTHPVTYTDSNGQQVTTQLQYKNGILPWLICLAICFFTGCICIAIIPFFINDLKDVYHINPNDGSVVGVYKRM